MTEPYSPPFPYFGGKSSVADIVWSAIGDVPNYVEPFFGSGAVLFMRPGGAGEIETVNDADGFLANFWRAVQHDPEATAAWADNPVNEADLHARHVWLVNRRESIADRLMGDPDWFDPKVAGWWCWGLCCWIAGGWCSGSGPWTSRDGVFVRREDGEDGQGVNRGRPHLGNRGQGVNRQLPHLSDRGQGVRRKLPDLARGRGVNRPNGNGTVAERRDYLIGYMRGLADRLRNVRVCCGDWSRVCGPTPTFKQGTTGVFLDPPYADTAGRDPGCYAVDSLTVAHDVRAWAIEAGKRDDMRIVLAGYEGEHEMPGDWRVVSWMARGGYGSQSDDEESNGRLNAHKERLWLSPACLTAKAVDRGLWGAEA